MKKIFKYIGLGIGGIVLLLVGGVIFHRVFIYPGNVRQECASRAYKATKNEDNIIQADLDYKFIYRNCFQENGLQAEE